MHLDSPLMEVPVSVISKGKLMYSDIPPTSVVWVFSNVKNTHRARHHCATISENTNANMHERNITLVTNSIST